MFNFKKFFLGFYHAYEGLMQGLKDRNMKLHIIMAIFLIPSSFYLKLSLFEWIVVLILIGLVWMAELFNSAIERLSDTVRDEMNLNYQATKHPRDIAAGAVLITALISACIGLIIYVPKIYYLITNV